MIVLNNGAQPLMWNVRPGGKDFRHYLGTVLAHLPHNSVHPYVVWTMASDDNQNWDCTSGHYLEDYKEAQEAFIARRNPCWSDR